jgi:hypothetical protein
MTEDLILHARHLLQRVDEKTAMDTLKTKGVRPEFAFLAVKAAKILREPYVYKEAKGRIIYYGDF